MERARLRRGVVTHRQSRRRQHRRRILRPRGPERPPPLELKAFIRERLSPQKTPAFWIWVDQWPMTGSGKIQKFMLRDQVKSSSAIE